MRFLRRRSVAQFGWLFSALLLVLSGCGADPSAVVQPQRPSLAIGTDTTTGALIETDKDDYSPGDTIHLVGHGWAPNELVNLSMSEDPDTHENMVQDVQADSAGGFSLDFYVVQELDLGVTFTLTATGPTSGSVAIVVFTDAISLKVFGADDAQHQTLAAEEDLGSIVQGSNLTLTCPRGTGLSIQAAGIGTGTQAWSLAYAGAGTDNATLSALTTLTPNSGSVTGSSEKDCVAVTITTGTLSAGSTYHGSLLATGSGAGDGPYFFRFTVTAPATAPDLSISKTDNAASFYYPSGGPGENGTYDIVVTNNGTGASTGTITVVDVLVAELDYVSFSGTNWSCTESPTRTITCTTSQVLAASGGTSSTLTLTVKPNQLKGGVSGNSVDNKASVSGGGDATSADSNTETTPILGRPDLTITKTDNAASFYYPSGGPGENGTYELVVTNGGNVATSGTITVVDVLVAELDYVGYSGTGWSCTESPVRTITCTSSDVLAASGGTSSTLTLTVKPNQLKGGASGNSVDNKASVSGAGDATSGDSNTETTPILGRPDIKVTKTASSDPLHYGVAGSYSILVENIGNASTTGAITISDVLPSQVDFTGYSGSGWSCTESPANTVSCDHAGLLAAGGSSTLTLNITPVTVADGVENTASASTDGEETATGNNSDDVTVDIAKAVTVTTLADPGSTQYSDKVKLSATVTKSVAGDGDITGYVKFHIRRADNSVVYDTPSPGNALNGSDQAEEYVQILEPASTLKVTAEYLGDDNFAGSTSSPAKDLTVGTEDAEGFTITNAGSAAVGVTSFQVVVGIKEALLGSGDEPDQNDGQMAGDVAKLSLTAAANGFSSNTNLTGSCADNGTFGGSGYAKYHKFTCTFSFGGPVIPVDVYTLSFTVGGILAGNFYGGTYEDVFSIWDPGAGFATGGGWFLLDGDRVSFGFSFTQTKGKTSVRGGLVVVRHLPGGGVCRAKSNSMNAPSVTGNVATLGGKGNYNCVIGGLTTVSQGNLNIFAVAVDNGTSGANQDQFRVQAMDQLSMLSLVLLGGGNVQVPQPQSNR